MPAFSDLKALTVMSSFSPRPPFSKLPHLLRKLVLGAAFSMTGLMAADLSSVRNLYVDWSLRPDPRSAAAFDLSVLHPQAELDMETRRTPWEATTWRFSTPFASRPARARP
jgi:hypothetical protein